eukprot:4867972-Pyramimonas_sp.AAC.1
MGGTHVLGISSFSERASWKRTCVWVRLDMEITSSSLALWYRPLRNAWSVGEWNRAPPDDQSMDDFAAR